MKQTSPKGPANEQAPPGLDATDSSGGDGSTAVVTEPQPPRRRAEPRLARTDPGEPPTRAGGDDTMIAADSIGAAGRSTSRLSRGSTVGRYVVIDHLGEGGMGVVYAAYDPELDRRIAIKLLQTDPHGSSLATGGRARLLREAQAMARLTHPNVIAVYDVGTFEDSVFVAMEFVDGCTMTQWTSDGGEQPRPWREVLDVFVAAGRGLVAAHASGIVHRDFKPDNVMIASSAAGREGIGGRVRVLDFGLARPQGTDSGSQLDTSNSGPGSLSGSSFDVRLTATGAVMGTPAYMAPEQHAGKAVDDRSDQFSFCVALYEALFGQRPFAGTTLPELARNVFDENVRPTPRGTKVPPWIRRAVLRGLSKDPDARHPSMRTLLDELTRDPTRSRKRVAYLVGAMMVAAGGFVVASMLGPDETLCRGMEQALHGVWDDEVRTRAQAAFEDEQKAFATESWSTVAEGLDTYTQDWVAMRTEACEATHVRGEQSDAVLTRRMACLDDRLHALDGLTTVLAEADRTVVERSVRAVHDLPALEPCADIDSLMQGVAPPEDPQTAQRVADLRADVERARSLASAGKVDRALQLARATVEAMRTTGYRPGIAESLSVLGGLHLQKGDTEQTFAAFEEAIDAAEAAGHDAEVVDDCIGLMLAEAWYRNRYDVALMYARRGEAVLQRVDAWPEKRARLLTHRAQVESRMGRHEDAIASVNAGLAIHRQLGTDRSPMVVTALNTASTQLIELERYDEARAQLDIAIEIARDSLGPLHPDVGVTEAALGRLLASQDDDAAAIEHLRKAKHVFEQSLGPEHSNVVAVLNGIGLAQHGLQREKEARRSYEEALAILEGTDDPDGMKLSHVLNNLGNLERELGNHEEAIAHLRRAMQIKLDLLGADHEEIAYARDNLGHALRDAGRYDEAIEQYEKAYATFEARYGTQDWRPAFSRQGLGMSLLGAGRTQQARRELQKAVQLFDAAGNADADDAADARFALARAMIADGADVGTARALAREALVMYLARPDRDAEARREIVDWLGE